LTVYWGVTNMAFEELQGFIERSQARRAEVQQRITEQQVNSLTRSSNKGKVASRSIPNVRGGKVGGGKVGGTPQKGKISLNELVDRIAAKESGGNYRATGDWNDGDRAYGKYQIMGNNIPSWTQRYLGKSLTPQQFLKREKAQDKVAKGQLYPYY